MKFDLIFVYDSERYRIGVNLDILYTSLKMTRLFVYDNVVY